MTADRLQRFVDAQEGVYPTVLAELRAGRKRTHWMWFVFPQLRGLGSSPMAQRYAIEDLDEARAYLAHPVLAPRLRECVATLLALETSDPVAVLGDLDAVKLRSSLTLFLAAGADVRPALDRFFHGAPDPLTDRLLTQ